MSSLWCQRALTRFASRVSELASLLLVHVAPEDRSNRDLAPVQTSRRLAARCRPARRVWKLRLDTGVEELLTPSTVVGSRGARNCVVFVGSEPGHARRVQASTTARRP